MQSGRGIDARINIRAAIVDKTLVDSTGNNESLRLEIENVGRDLVYKTGMVQCHSTFFLL